MSSVLPKNKFNIYLELIFYIFSLFLFLASAYNIAKYLTPKKVLGISTQKTLSENEFWQLFLNKNPNYIPGLIQSGNLAKIKEIDPNYQSQ